MLEIEGGADTTLDARAAASRSSRASASALGELQRGSRNLFTGPFPKEGYQWHRLVPLAASSLRGPLHGSQVPGGRSHVYLRARQQNGHMAWASPVFLNYR